LQPEHRFVWCPWLQKSKEVQKRKDLIQGQLVKEVKGFIQDLKSRSLSELASETSNERHNFVQSHQEILEDAAEEEGPNNNSTSQS
jgi:hypothetical protein